MKVYASMVEKFKIIPRAVVAPKKGEEEQKGETAHAGKKVSMGKGYFSIEQARIGQSQVFLVVFRNLIGKTLFQGTLNATQSKKRRIEEKAMKL